MFRILLVEDNEKIRHIIAETLVKWQYEVEAPQKFDAIDDAFHTFDPHLVIMDINLPVYDGYYWCQKIRQTSKVPLIFLSSRTENMDIIMAMNMGGDDFIQKPFSLDVLAAKVNAQIRRNYTYQETGLNTLVHRGLTLHLTNSTIEFRSETAELTRNEFIILQLMMRRIREILSRDELMQVLWNDNQFVDDNTLTVNVNRLRKKVTALGLENFIATRKGMGYCIQ